MFFARADLPDRTPLEAVVTAARPGLILGLSGRKGTITEGAIRAMAEACERPIVMPLSNPTSACEVTPAHFSAISRRYLGDISAISRRYLGDISCTLR